MVSSTMGCTSGMLSSSEGYSRNMTTTPTMTIIVAMVSQEVGGADDVFSIISFVLIVN
jgi:hypothetical protein